MHNYYCSKSYFINRAEHEGRSQINPSSLFPGKLPKVEGKFSQNQVNNKRLPPCFEQTREEKENWYSIAEPKVPVKRVDKQSKSADLKNEKRPNIDSKFDLSSELSDEESLI